MEAHPFGGKWQLGTELVVGAFDGCASPPVRHFGRLEHFLFAHWHPLNDTHVLLTVTFSHGRPTGNSHSGSRVGALDVVGFAVVGELVVATTPQIGRLEHLRFTHWHPLNDAQVALFVTFSQGRPTGNTHKGVTTGEFVVVGLAVLGAPVGLFVVGPVGARDGVMGA